MEGKMSLEQSERRDFTAKELETFVMVNSEYIHVFPPNGDTKAAQERLSQYAQIIKEAGDFLLRRDNQ